MEHFRAAEQALVTALILGESDPRDLAGRVRVSDFTDPAAAVLFEAALQADPGKALAEQLPAVLRREGRLRPDGYPIAWMLEWMPQLPAPVHLEAWATLVVAGSIGRQVRASGERLQQSAEAAVERRCGTGRLLALVAAQRAAIGGSRRRWEDLPARWRDSIPTQSLPREDAGGDDPIPRLRDDGCVAAGRERGLLGGLVAAPQLLAGISWLHEPDFTDPSFGAVFGTLRRLHDAGRPVDPVTLAAACDPRPVPTGGESPAELVAGLRREEGFPTMVPFLARGVLAQAISRDVHAVGVELVRLAAAPAGEGGLGGALLAAAQSRLETLRAHAVRWESATRDGRGRDALGPANLPSRLRTPEQRPTLSRAAGVRDRHAG